MTIQKKQLLDALKLAMPGIETGNATLQGSDAFVFHNGNIFSYNDSISVSVPLSQAGLVEENLEGAVKAEEFFKVIGKFPGDEISFVANEGSWILKSGKAKAEMTLMDFDFETRLKGIEPSEEWVTITEDFITGLAICKMTNNKSPLSGIYINGKEIFSTDGWQINRYTMNECELPIFWISDKTVDELLKIGKFTSMQVQGTWVHFKTEEGTLFSAKTLFVDKYPFDKVKSLLSTSNPKDTDFHAKFPRELFNAIDRATSFSIDISEHSAVRLVLSKEKIVVSAERSSGKYEEKISWEDEVGDFEKMTVYVDATMMQYAGTRTLEFYIQKGPVRNGKTIPRLLFVTSQSIHLMSTLNNGDE